MTVSVIPDGELLSTAEREVGWVNRSGLSADRVAPHIDKVARELASWVESTRGIGNFYERNAYIAPESPYALMRIAKNAVENDDIVGGVADVTEGLMFQGLKWECENADDADIFNQIARDLNLDQIVRQWHREEFTYSQVVVGMWWDQKTYTVRGRTIEDPADPADGSAPKAPPIDPVTQMPVPQKRTKGARRRKKYDVFVPSAMTFLDPMRVVPLSPGPFGQDRLAWHATVSEIQTWTDMETSGMVTDRMMAEFFLARIPLASIDIYEREILGRMGINPGRLILLNPERVWRWCRTKAPYERFPQFRLKGCFPLLDLKQQLMEADRVGLTGAINYILLVRKGMKDDPASQDEIDNLRENFRIVAKLPVVVGDHRLQIDVISPDQTHVLQADRYDTVDRRILARCLGALTVASSGQRNETSITIARGIARMLENRRHMMKRELEIQIARSVVEHPRNRGKFEEEPNLAFTPRNVQLDADAMMTEQIMALRQQKELSRESTLEYFGFDQETEAQRREYEELSGLDDVFQTQVPFSSPNLGGQPGVPGQPPNPNGGPQAPSVSGARGGRPRTGSGATKKAAAVKPAAKKTAAATKKTASGRQAAQKEDS